MKKYIPLILLSIFTLTAVAQDDEGDDNERFVDKLVYGGNLGLNFGTFTYIEAAPRVGYKVTNWFVPGVGLSYQYLGNRFGNYSIVGGSAFARVFPIPQLFGHAELERIAFGYKDQWIDKRDYLAGTRLLLGGGLQYSLGGSVTAGVTVLWDVIDHSDPLRNGDPDPLFGLFPNPIIRAGIMVGM